MDEQDGPGDAHIYAQIMDQLDPDNNKIVAFIVNMAWAMFWFGLIVLVVTSLTKEPLHVTIVINKFVNKLFNPACSSQSGI